MFFGKSNWRTFEDGLEKEWLLTNGIGGFACSTIIGANARRYHGLLTASLHPPVERHLVLSQVSECLETGSETHFLHAFRTPDFKAHGENYMEGFSYDYIPTYHYRVRDTFIDKSITMVYGENKTAIVYHIRNGSINAKLRLTPLVNFRNYHYTSSSPYLEFSVDSDGRIMELTPYKMDRKIRINCNEGKLVLNNECYFYNMQYNLELERGLDAVEDHFIPGFYVIDIAPGEEKIITFIAAFDEDMEAMDGMSLIQKEKTRQKLLSEKEGPSDSFLSKLTRAADKFIVKRESTKAKTIIAGYPWFTDWGRDTMIALPGLTLSTGRFEDAREILYTFSRYVKDGLIPNVFPDGDSEPAYNTVDASLWFFEAVYKYLVYSKDLDFIKAELFRVLEQIVSGYQSGTHYSIGMEQDGLISAGNANTQLTWMDAKVGDWVVTPRYGKVVEINALWYNALMIMSDLSKRINGDDGEYLSMAQRVKASFFETFWNKELECLFDVVGTGFKDSKIRPNQIIALSLSYPVLDGDYARAVVDVVFKELYTAFGLRSLSQRHEQYRGIYMGDQYARDGAYHQGTVWTWPLGQFITAYSRAYPQIDKAYLERFFLPFRDHLKDACIENISEIFDGDEPLLPRGCSAQAWSVAEILRAYCEEILNYDSKER